MPICLNNSKFNLKEIKQKMLEEDFFDNGCISASNR